MADAQAPRTRYRSIIADSGRWDGFAFRPGDVVISTPPKCGTTWTQMLCALLIFDGPDVPGAARRGVAVAGHVHPPARRGDGGARRPDASPLHQDAHAPRRPAAARRRHVSGGRPRSARRRHLVGASRRQHGLRALPGSCAPRPSATRTSPSCRSVRVPSEDPVERFRSFVADETHVAPPTLASVLHHLDTGWQRRRDPNVALFHYADLQADLAGELLRLARVLGIPCSPERARELAAEASLARMRERAADVAPNASQGIWKDVRAFFRSGGSGEWRERLSAADLAAYEARVAAARRPGSRRLGARRPARVGRRSRTLTRPRATARVLGSAPARGDAAGRSASRVVGDRRCTCPP